MGGHCHLGWGIVIRGWGITPPGSARRGCPPAPRPPFPQVSGGAAALVTVRCGLSARAGPVTLGGCRGAVTLGHLGGVTLGGWHGVTGPGRGRLRPGRWSLGCGRGRRPRPAPSRLRSPAGCGGPRPRAQPSTGRTSGHGEGCGLGSGPSRAAWRGRAHRPPTVRGSSGRRRCGGSGRRGQRRRWALGSARRGSPGRGGGQPDHGRGQPVEAAGAGVLVPRRVRAAFAVRLPLVRRAVTVPAGANRPVPGDRTRCRVPSAEVRRARATVTSRGSDSLHRPVCPVGWGQGNYPPRLARMKHTPQMITTRATTASVIMMARSRRIMTGRRRVTRASRGSGAWPSSPSRGVRT